MANDVSLPRRGERAAERTAFPRPFGAYLLVAPVAEGGMGALFLAKHRNDRDEEDVCVVKQLRAELSGDREYVTRFIDEARITVTLDHPNIAEVFDVGRVGDDLYLAMEYVSGVDLKALEDRCLEQRTLVPIPAALQIAIDVLAALDYAHHQKHPLTGEPLDLVHRDVSPHNVLVAFDGHVTLIDFGLATSRLKIEKTLPNIVMGKMAYMSPEQARGAPVDARTDVFTAAMVLVELLTGERFYEGLTPNQIFNTVGKGGHRPPHYGDIDAELRAVLDRALAARAVERFQDAASFRRALLEILYGRFATGGAEALQKTVVTLMAREMTAEWARLADLVDVSLGAYREVFDTTVTRAVSLAVAAEPSSEEGTHESTDIKMRRARRTRTRDVTEVVRTRGTGTAEPTLAVRRPRADDEKPAARKAVQVRPTTMKHELARRAGPMVVAALLGIIVALLIAIVVVLLRK